MLIYYTATKMPATTNGSMYLYIPREWGFEAGEMVNVNMTQDEEKMYLGKDCLLGGSGRKARILIDKSWNFDPDKLVRFTMYRRTEAWDD